MQSYRIPTTHVGSLVRPPELVDLLHARSQGQDVDAERYAGTLRRSVADVVCQQAEAGLDLVSDGEFGKGISWSRYVLERLDGFEYRSSGDARSAPGAAGVVPNTPERRRFADFYDEYDRTQGFEGDIGAWVCTGPVRYRAHETLQRDIDNLKLALDGAGGVQGFVPAVAPASVASGRQNEHYASDEELLFAVADALRTEYRAIVNAGLVLQVDDAWFPMMYELLVPPGTMEDYRRWAQVRLEALNHALEGLPEERVRYHVCWGSWNAPHTGDVPLREIIDLVLQVRAGGYSLEQANVRHEHEWRLWEDVPLPPGKVLLPGVISHATNVVEHPELVAERITRLARLVGADRVTASTDCGFAQGPFVRRVHPSIMWAKLTSLVEGARLAGGRLFGTRV
jgi:5-methyltetrahydropteroyltriglutamate--homocysteine methyltransferase